MTSTQVKQGWQIKKLKDLPFEIIDGDRSSNYPKRDEFQSFGIPFFSTPNIQDNQLILNDLRFITKEKFDSLRKGKLQKHDIMMTTRGSVGNFAYFDCQYETGFINAQMLILRANETEISSRFFYYLFTSPTAQEKFQNYASGSAQPQLPIKDLKEIQFLLPPLPTQQKIASILSAFDDLIENNTKRIKILENTAQLIYKEWFVDFKFPGHEKVKMVDSGTEFGEIPEGWEVKEIGDICITSSGGTPSRKREEEFYQNGTIEWVKTKELNDGFILETEEKITELAIEKSSAKAFPPLTVLLAMYGATIGKLGILSMEATTNQACCAFLAGNTYFSSYYLFQFLKFNIKSIIALGMGAAQQNISQQVIKKIPILQPHEKILMQYDNMIKSIFDEILLLQRLNRKLRNTRDLLLPKLVSGDEDVSRLSIQLT
ncbi:restriction endonuclease subunit S [Candidatus Peregrinibacteria bacterium]|nr:MAG: restriction endonuclease subunit S [Candidatus Peregrinibacteria bacterium]